MVFCEKAVFSCTDHSLCFLFIFFAVYNRDCRFRAGGKYDKKSEEMETCL